MPGISRRDFLKASLALAGATAFSRASRYVSSAAPSSAEKPNILLFVFDAMSARHLSLYGYPRQTTPSLQKFAERATVYHRHYSAGNFTTPGTASMLTGMYPWTHRAFNYRGMMARTLVERNLFHLVGNEYARFAFTQNLWADILLDQFAADLEFHPPSHAYSQVVYTLPQSSDIPRDRTMAYYAFQDFLNLRVDDATAFPGSLLLASADLARALRSGAAHTSAEYPRGLPTNHDFAYEHATLLDGISQLIQATLPSVSPYLAYFHLWSPHEPYNARREFVDIFQDELQMAAKPRHPLAGGEYPDSHLRQKRREYDEFIADLDAEFGRVISELESSGSLENTYVVVTSDHGELFERGELGHASALLYASVTHIPLLIRAPEQRTRVDVHSLTSNLDLAPTILRIVGKELPNWMEGRLLPGFGGSEDASRSIFPMVAKDNAAFRRIDHASFSILKGPYEMFFFTGYPGHEDRFELYNLEQDPDELEDLSKKDITTASHLKAELLEAIDAANRNYQKNH